MAETEQRREERATELAYAKGRKDAQVDARLDGHEKRLNAINGSIDRHAHEAAQLRKTIEQVDGKVDGIVATLDKNAAVEEERVAQIKDANEKQISTRTFWLGVATICVMLLVGYATVAATLHGG